MVIEAYNRYRPICEEIFLDLFGKIIPEFLQFYKTGYRHSKRPMQQCVTVTKTEHEN